MQLAAPPLRPFETFIAVIFLVGPILLKAPALLHLGLAFPLAASFVPRIIPVRHLPQLFPTPFCGGGNHVVASSFCRTRDGT